MTYSDIYIRAEDEAHAVRIAQGADVLGLLDDDGTPYLSIPLLGSTYWKPTEALIVSRGTPITPEVQYVLSLVPDEGFKVFYLPTQPRTGDTEETPSEPISGAWYVLRLFAPLAAVSMLQAQLSVETWADNTTKVLVTREDFPTLTSVQ